MIFHLKYLQLIFKTLTLKKLFNFIKLKISFFLGIVKAKVLPFAISIEPINTCNLKCPECITGSGLLKRKKGEMDIEKYGILIEQIKKHIIHLFLYFQGEPLLNKNFIKMVELAKKSKLFVATSTNGHFLNDENCKNIVLSKLDHIIISLDGVSEDTYQKYRKNGSLETVKKGIETLIKYKKTLKSNTPLIELQFIVFEHNEKEISQFIELSKTLSVDKWTIKTAQIYNINDKNSGIKPPLSDKFSRYKLLGEKYELKKKHYCEKCWRQWSSCVITIDGQMAPCCYDKEASMSYGNVFESDFSSCWFSQKNIILRKTLSEHTEPKICKDCPE